MIKITRTEKFVQYLARTGFPIWNNMALAINLPPEDIP